jgi:hypothetical protein
MARAVLDWPQFLGGGRKALTRASEQLGLIWPYWCESALADIDQFVSADLRHQRASEADLRVHPAVSDLVRETYAAMIDLVQDPADSCVPRGLDDLRACFETASAIFDWPMREVNEEVRRSGHKRLQRSIGPKPSLATSPIEAGEGVAIPREPDLLPSGNRAQKRPWRTPRTWRRFAIRCFSIRRTTSRRTRTFVRREWTLRSTIWFTEVGRAEILGHFSRPRPISPDTPTSPQPASTPSCITKRRDAEKTE